MLISFGRIRYFAEPGKSADPIDRDVEEEEEVWGENRLFRLPRLPDFPDGDPPQL